MKSKSIGYVTGHNFGGWKIPQKIQTAVMHFNANKNNILLDFVITEYMDSEKNNILIKTLHKNSEIKNIFFTSALQIREINNNTYKILNNYNLYFFLENIVIKKNSGLLNLKKYLMLVSNRKQNIFHRKSYLDIFSNYKKSFK